MKEAFDLIQKRLRNQFDTLDVDGDNDWNCATRQALSIVSEVEAEFGKDINVRSNGWIPCSERLPNNTDDVLVTTAYGLVIDAYLSTQKNWCFRNGTRITDLADMPIAWMPLPSPYKPTTD